MLLLVIFISIFLIATVIVGILEQIGIIPITGTWAVSHLTELLQGILVASAALLALSTFFIAQISRKLNNDSLKLAKSQNTPQ